MTSLSLAAALSDATLAASMTFADQHRYMDGSANCGLNPHDIYEPIFADVPHFDARYALCYIPAGADTEHATAFGGYVKNASAATNGVGGFFCCMATANGAHVWGVNTLLQDSATRAVGNLTGAMLFGAELDFNVMCPATHVIGVSIGGNSLSQPESAVGYVVNTLGSGKKWTTGFYSLDGVAQIGAALGATEASGSNVPSQPLFLQYFNASGAKKTARLYASGCRVTLSNDDDWLVFSVQGYINTPAGKGIAVADQLVVAGRTGGFGAMTGTASKATIATYDAPTADGSLAQLQTLMNAVQALSRRMKAMDDVEFFNGRIGP